MLDSLNPFFRHLILVLAGALLTWVGTDLVPLLSGKGGLAAVAGSLVVMLIAYATPLITSYGVGAKAAAQKAADFTLPDAPQDDPAADADAPPTK